MWLLVNHKKTNKHFVLKLIAFSSSNYQSASKQLQDSGQLQNNSINGATLITMNNVINN